MHVLGYRGDYLEGTMCVLGYRGNFQEGSMCVRLQG